MLVQSSLVAAVVAGCAHCPLCGGPWDGGEMITEPVRPAEMMTISGSVSCMERVTILPTFELKVRLVSLDAPGGADAVIAEQVIKPVNEFPVHFSFEYDNSKLSDQGSYGLEAKLLSQDTVLFTTDTQYRVLTHGQSAQADIVIVRSR